jgi:hypothetical protein
MAMIGHARWPRFAVLLGEIEVYRHRLPKDLAVVLKGRNVPLGVYLQIFGFARVALRIERNVFVLESQLLQRPHGSCGARRSGSVQFQHRILLQHSVKERPSKRRDSREIADSVKDIDGSCWSSDNAAGCDACGYQGDVKDFASWPAGVISLNDYRRRR